MNVDIKGWMWWIPKDKLEELSEVVLPESKGTTIAEYLMQDCKREIMNDQQKIDLGEMIFRTVGTLVIEVDQENCKNIANLVLNKIQELTQDHETSEEFADRFQSLDPKDHEVTYKLQNNGPEHQNAPSDNTEVGQYQTTGEKHHVCGCCYQSYPAKYLERNFMTCNPCKDTGKERPTCLDKNGKLFTAGDLLRNENSLKTEVRILQIQPDTIIFNSTENLPKLRGCVEKQDFIDAGWIVHERVTPYEVGPTDFGTIKCRFKNFMIADPGCIICDHCMGVNSEQKWVICELYNKEDEG